MSTSLVIPNGNFEINAIPNCVIKIKKGESVTQYIGYTISSGQNIPGPNATAVVYHNNNQPPEHEQIIPWDDIRIKAAIAGGKSHMMGGMLRGDSGFGLEEVRLVAYEDDVLCDDGQSFVGGYMFRGCFGLKHATIDIKKFYPVLSNFFGECRNLRTVDFAQSDFSGVSHTEVQPVYAYSMFYNCLSLQTVDCSKMEQLSIDFIKQELTYGNFTFTDDGNGFITITGWPTL